MSETRVAGLSRVARQRPGVVAVGAVLLTLLTALVGLPAAYAADPSDAANGFVTATSDTGEGIGSGTPREWFAPGGGTLTVTGDSTEVRVYAADGPSGSSFNFDLAAVRGQALAVGDYEQAQRTPFRDDTHPGIDISGDFHGCNTTFGRFTVNDIHLGADGVVDRLDLTYAQECGTNDAWLHGEISLNEPQADPDVEVMPSAMQFTPTYPGTTSTTSQARLVNTGSGDLNISAATLTGADPALFHLPSQTCVGTLAPGATCTVDITFAPAAGDQGAKSATLTLTDDSTAGHHDVPITASVTPGHTTWDMVGDGGDPVVGPAYYHYTPVNASWTHVGGDTDGVSFVLDSGNTTWNASFRAPAGAGLAPGTYQVPGDTSASSPQMSVNKFTGYYCSSFTGSFTVYEYALDPVSGKPSDISLTWEQHCQGWPAAAYGSIAYHATDAAHPMGGPGSAGDTTSPGLVNGLTAMGSSTGGKLVWQNPPAADLARVIVRGAAGLTAPATPTSGTAIYSGTGQAVRLGTLTPHRSYSYSVWTRDTRGNTSGARRVTLHGSAIGFAVPRPVPYGAGFNIAAKVVNADNGRALSNVEVRFLRRDPGSSIWRTITTEPTDNRGIVTWAISTKHTILLKAVFLGSSGHVGVTSGTPTIRVEPNVNGGYYGSLPAGQTQVIHGRVLPNLAGHRISLQRYAAGHWTTYRSALLNGDSKFSFSFVVGQRGTYKYRLVMAKTQGLVALDLRVTFAVT